MNKWIFLSYELDDKAFGYGNGDRMKQTQIRSIKNGDSSNNSYITMPTHYGTHIDFPLHFSTTGKNSSQFDATFFTHENIGFMEINNEKIEDYLIRNNHLNCEGIAQDITLLIIKTGFCDNRYDESYWNYNWGFHHETALHLKSHFPHLQAIAFDLISLSSYQQRTEGRIAHKAFLCEQEILIVEDVDLRNISAKDSLQQVVIAPLRIKEVDGTSVTIMALLK